MTSTFKTEWQAGSQEGRKTDGQAGRHMESYIDGWMDE